MKTLKDKRLPHPQYNGKFAFYDEDDVRDSISDYIKIKRAISMIDNSIIPKKYLELCLKYNLFILSHKYTDLEVFEAVFGDWNNEI